jgi:hypothetical protein
MLLAPLSEVSGGKTKGFKMLAMNKFLSENSQPHRVDAKMMEEEEEKK